MKKRNTRVMKRAAMLIVMMLLVVACGKRDNVVNTGNLDAPTTQNNSPILSDITQYEGCPSPIRLQFSTAGVGSGSNGRTTITGPFNPGLISGVESAIYLGKSNFQDLMVITKMTNGGGVIGYNVTLALCPYEPIISANRPLSNFQAQNIVLDDNTNCQYGNIDYAVSYLTAEAIGYHQTAQFSTNFAPHCGQ
jgi:hypothetical protein